MPIIPLHFQRYSYVEPEAGDGVPHDSLKLPPVEEEGKAVATFAEEQTLSSGAIREGEARGWDAVGGGQRGG